jgi:hypothetical protein
VSRLHSRCGPGSRHASTSPSCSRHLRDCYAAVGPVAAFADDKPVNRAIQQEVWAIPVILPTIAYVVRPVGDGPFPLVVMNHGVSLNQRERSFFPLVEFRDAAMWFARRGYMVVAPSGGMAPGPSMNQSAASTPCSIQRSAVATIRTSAKPGLRWRCYDSARDSVADL